MKKARRVALYLRVSTVDQTAANQHRELKAVGARHGWDVVAIFNDEGISGTNRRNNGPASTSFAKASLGVISTRWLRGRSIG